MQEKRQFFRIEQDVVFNFCVVSNDSVIHNRAEQHFEHSETLSLFSELQHIDSNSISILEEIKEESPKIAEYLDIVNRKLNLISQQVLATQASVHDVDSGRIDISQGGLAFQSEKPIGIETWLAVKLIFLPTYVGIISYAQVTRCVSQGDGSYLIGVRFHGLTDDQSRLIAKQIFNTQVVERQQTYTSRDRKSVV